MGVQRKGGGGIFGGYTGRVVARKELSRGKRKNPPAKLISIKTQCCKLHVFKVNCNMKEYRPPDSSHIEKKCMLDGVSNSQGRNLGCLVSSTRTSSSSSSQGMVRKRAVKVSYSQSN